MLQLEMDFDAMPGVVDLTTYTSRRPAPKRRTRLSTPAEVRVFPLARQHATIREVARELKTIRGKKRAAYWQSIIASLATQLGHARLSKEDVDRELLKFKDAVQRELYRDHQSRPFGGAA